MLIDKESMFLSVKNPSNRHRERKEKREILLLEMEGG